MLKALVIMSLQPLMYEHKNTPVPYFLVVFLHLPRNLVEAFPQRFPVSEEERRCVIVTSYRESRTAVVKR